MIDVSCFRLIAFFVTIRYTNLRCKKNVPAFLTNTAPVGCSHFSIGMRYLADDIAATLTNNSSHLIAPFCYVVPFAVAAS
jgi:hypothetical protein